MKFNSAKTPLAATLALTTMLVSTGATAADFSVHKYEEDYDDGPGAYIVMTGETQYGDYQRFLEVLPEAISIHGSREYKIDVWLEGPGGYLDEALKLGQLVYDLGFATFVDDGDECASACALIWLGGGSLYAVEGAQIGFHQAYLGEGEASISANAKVGHYLSQVALEANVVSYVVGASPDEMTWLTPEVATAIDLPVDYLN